MKKYRIKIMPGDSTYPAITLLTSTGRVVENWLAIWQTADDADALAYLSWFADTVVC